MRAAWRELLRTPEPVEKVGIGLVNDLEPGAKRPKIGVSGVRSGSRTDTRGFFNRLTPSRKVDE
jgi:hypothetical protein